jgi:hypothetical protein
MRRQEEEQEEEEEQAIARRNIMVIVRVLWLEIYLVPCGRSGCGY